MMRSLTYSQLDFKSKTFSIWDKVKQETLYSTDALCWTFIAATAKTSFLEFCIWV